MVRTVPAPNMVLTDSVDALGKKIDRSTLLSVSVNTDFSSVAHNIVNANPLVITKPTENHTIGLAGFNVYSTLFTNASLTIATDAPAEVYIDNKQVTSKSDKENSCVVPLLLEPMRLYQVAVKMLVSATDSVNATLTSSISAENENASVVITTDNKRFYQLTDNFIGTRVRSVGISPCGKYLLTSYTSRTDTKTSANYSILTDTKTGKQIAPRFTSPVQWMPKSSKLYFTTPTTTGQDINTFDPQTGKTEVLAHNVPKTGYFYIAPTEDFMVYAIEESALKSQGPLTRHASTMDRVDGRGRYHIALYNFATAASTRLTAGNHSAHLQDISNDGKRILFSKHTTDYSHRQQLRVDLYQIDLTTMTTDTLLAHQWFFNTASFSPDASQVLITAGPDAFNGIGRNCGNLPIANDYDNQAFILDIASRDIKPITKLFDPSLTSANWNSNGNIYMCAKERDIETIYEYNPVRNTYTRLNTATEMARGLSLSDNGQMAAYTGMGLDHSTRAYIYDMRKAKSTLVADPMAETYTKLELGKVEDFEFSYDSTVIDGFICYPPQFDESKKYPMIVYYYAGTTPSQRWNEYYYGYLFASRGYVVYVLNPSGTIGYGQEFSARHVNAQAGALPTK